MLKVVIIPTKLATSRGRLTNIDGKQASQEVANHRSGIFTWFCVDLSAGMCVVGAHVVSTGKTNAIDLRWSIYIDDILNFSELDEKLIDIDAISIDTCISTIF